MTKDEIHNLLSDNFLLWDKIDDTDKAYLTENCEFKNISKGTIIRGKDKTCLGMIIVINGQLRSYITSENGKEITLYRLLPKDFCLLSVSCTMKNIQLDVFIDAQEDTKIILLPTPNYKYLIDHSFSFLKFVNEQIESKLSEVLWLLEDIVFKSLDIRLANYLLEIYYSSSSNIIYTTHNEIAINLASSREVITRMLKYFQNEGIISVHRGAITILELNKLEKLVM